MSGRFIHEPLEAAGLPEFAGAGIRRVDRELRRQQHGVDAGFRDLLWHQLPVAHVAFEGGAIAVEEHHDHAGLAGVESFGDMHQHAVVVVGLVLPVDPPRIAAMALALALGDVEERRFRPRIVAEIGEGGGFHADQRGQLIALGLARKGERRRDRGDADRLGARAALRLWCHRGGGLSCDCDRPLSKTFPLGRKAIPELRRREAIFECVAGTGLRIGGEHAGVRCPAALGEHERKRHEQRGDGRQVPPGSADAVRRGR